MSKMFDLRTFSEAVRLAMTAEGLTGRIVVQHSSGDLTAQVGQMPDMGEDDFDVTISIRNYRDGEPAIERFEPFSNDDDGEFTGMKPWPEGGWVRFSDVAALLSEDPA